MNKIGFNLLPWSAGVSEKLNPTLEKLKEIGYNGIESFIGSPDQKEYKAMGAFAQNIGLEVTSVFVLGASENPISTDNTIRKQALNRIKWAVDRAVDLGAGIICGPFHSAHSHFSYQAPSEEEYLYAAEVLHAAADYAKQANVSFALEAVNRFENYLCNTMEQLAKLVKLIDHPNARAMYDSHHANIEEKTILQPLQQIQPYLNYVHISENDRGTPGMGLCRWEETFSALSTINYKGWYTIEAFSRADPDFANSINVWREYSAPWEIAEKGYTFIKEMLCKHE